MNTNSLLKKCASVLILSYIMASQIGCNAKSSDAAKNVNVTDVAEIHEITETLPDNKNPGAYTITEKKRMNDGLHLSNDAVQYSQLEQMIADLSEDIP